MSGLHTGTPSLRAPTRRAFSHVLAYAAVREVDIAYASPTRPFSQTPSCEEEAEDTHNDDVEEAEADDDEKGTLSAWDCRRFLSAALRKRSAARESRLSS